MKSRDAGYPITVIPVFSTSKTTAVVAITPVRGFEQRGLTASWMEAELRVSDPKSPQSALSRCKSGLLC
jgi:hypothetical protein